MANRFERVAERVSIRYPKVVGLVVDHKIEGVKKPENRLFGKVVIIWQNLHKKGLDEQKSPKNRHLWMVDCSTRGGWLWLTLDKLAPKGYFNQKERNSGKRILC